VKQLILYDGSTGKILAALKKSTDSVGIAVGTGVIGGDTLSGISLSSGDLLQVLAGDTVNLLYDAKRQMPSKRLLKDAGGNPVIGPNGFPVVEEYFIDMTWKDFEEAVAKAVVAGKIVFEKAVSKSDGCTAAFTVLRNVDSLGFTDAEASKVIDDFGEPNAEVLKIDSEIDIKHPEWKVDLGTGHLVKISQITYE